MHTARPRGLHADDLHPTAPPRGDASDEPTATHGHEDGVERREPKARLILLPFEADGPLPGQRRGALEGMHDGEIRLEPLWRFRYMGESASGAIQAQFESLPVRPAFFDRLAYFGEGDAFLAALAADAKVGS